MACKRTYQNFSICIILVISLRVKKFSSLMEFEMLFFKKVMLIAILSLAFSVNASEIDIPREKVFIPQRLASSSSLKFFDQQFNLVLDGKDHKIKSYDVRGLPCSLTPEIIENFLNNGYFSVGKSGEDYTLTANLRLLGGMEETKKTTAIIVAGAATGAAIGSIVPLVGTTVGAITGAISAPIVKVALGPGMACGGRGCFCACTNCGVLLIAGTVLWGMKYYFNSTPITKY